MKFLYSKYFLPEYIKIVSGMKSDCLINIKNGEYTLINHSACEVLSFFRDGETPSNQLGLRRPERSFQSLNILLGQRKKDEYYNQLILFLKRAVSHGILISENNYSTERNTNNEKQLSSSLALTLELSRYCNLKCLHCYNKSGVNATSSLSRECIVKLFKEMREIYSSPEILILTGGEPFLFNNLLDIIKIGFDHGFKKVRINTNGTILPKNELRTFITKHADQIEIQITLLGLDAKIHDFISTLAGTFNRTLSTIKVFLDTNASITCSLMKTKFLNTNDIEPFEKELGVKISLGDIFPVGRAKEVFEVISPSENHNEFIDKSNQQKGFFKLSEEKVKSLQENYPPELPCGKNTFSVSSNGDLLPCTLLQGIIIGNIHNDKTTNILRSKKMVEFLDKIKIDSRPVCNNCELRYVCKNKCPAVSLFYGGGLGRKNPFCKYYN